MAALDYPHMAPAAESAIVHVSSETATAAPKNTE